jgi:hypothetical protein
MNLQEKRNNERIKCDHDYFCSPRSLGNKIDCTLKNISATGACISTNVDLEHQENIILHICRGRDVSINSKVIWKNGTTYGLELQLNTSDDLNNISFVLNNIHKKQTFC